MEQTVAGGQTCLNSAANGDATIWASGAVGIPPTELLLCHTQKTATLRMSLTPAQSPERMDKSPSARGTK